MNFRARKSRSRSRPTRSPARIEAEALFRMVLAGGNSVANVRELIAVPPGLEEQTKQGDLLTGVERNRLLNTLRFRKQVLKEFDALVSDHYSRRRSNAATSTRRSSPVRSLENRME
jgi:hypothetical protein